MFYLIRHGTADYTEKDTKIYQGFGNHLAPLSAKGIREIETTAADPRLAQARLILSSPYTRALLSAAILSRCLQIPLQVETDLHEWLADQTYVYLPDEQAAQHYNEFQACNGLYPPGEEKAWESLPAMRLRMIRVFQRYQGQDDLLVVCHGLVIQSLCGFHPGNGEIVEFDLDSCMNDQNTKRKQRTKQNEQI